MTVAVHVQMQDTEYLTSSLKFGSYDPSNVRAGDEMQMMGTAGKETWDLKMGYLKVGDDKGHVSNSFVRFDPGVPYVYLDNINYKRFMKKMNESAGTKICHEGVHICKHEVPCHKINNNMKITFQL